MVFCNSFGKDEEEDFAFVTILILIDGFLQCRIGKNSGLFRFCHNPYFNRWFSAIRIIIKGVKTP